MATPINIFIDAVTVDPIPIATLFTHHPRPSVASASLLCFKYFSDPVLYLMGMFSLYISVFEMFQSITMFLLHISAPKPAVSPFVRQAPICRSLNISSQHSLNLSQLL